MAILFNKEKFADILNKKLSLSKSIREPDAEPMALRSEVIAAHWLYFYFMKQFSRRFALSICRKESQEGLISFLPGSKRSFYHLTSHFSVHIFTLVQCHKIK